VVPKNAMGMPTLGMVHLCNNEYKTLCDGDHGGQIRMKTYNMIPKGVVFDPCIPCLKIKGGAIPEMMGPPADPDAPLEATLVE
jgi:hypothetical protein